MVLARVLDRLYNIRMGMIGVRGITERFNSVYGRGLSDGRGVSEPVDAVAPFMRTKDDWLRLALACIDQGMKSGDRKLEQAMALVIDVVETEDE